MSMLQTDRPATAVGYEDEGGPAPVEVPPRPSGLARTSLVLGLCGLVACVAFDVVPVLAVVFGLFALRQIRRSGGERTGRKEAVAGIALGLVGTVIFAALVATETLTLTASVGDKSVLHAKYRDNGVAFEYPSTWDQHDEATVGRTAGGSGEFFQIFLSRAERDGIMVDGYRMESAFTEATAAYYAGEIEDLLHELMGDEGDILSGPTPLEDGPFPGYSATVSLRAQDGAKLHTTYTYLFDGATNYSVTCQHHLYPDDVAEACAQIIDTFRTT